MRGYLEDRAPAPEGCTCCWSWEPEAWGSSGGWVVEETDNPCPVHGVNNENVSGCTGPGE